MAANAIVQACVDGAVKEEAAAVLASFKGVKALMDDLNADD